MATQELTDLDSIISLKATVSHLSQHNALLQQELCKERDEGELTKQRNESNQLISKLTVQINALRNENRRLSSIMDLQQQTHDSILKHKQRQMIQETEYYKSQASNEQRKYNINISKYQRQTQHLEQTVSNQKSLIESQESQIDALELEIQELVKTNRNSVSDYNNNHNQNERKRNAQDDVISPPKPKKRKVAQHIYIDIIPNKRPSKKGITIVRWTEEENSAVLSGYAKYKNKRNTWVSIKKDPKFSQILHRRKAGNIQTQYINLQKAKKKQIQQCPKNKIENYCKLNEC